MYGRLEILKVLRPRVRSASFVDPRLQYTILRADDTNNEGQLHAVIDALSAPDKNTLRVRGRGLGKADSPPGE